MSLVRVIIPEASGLRPDDASTGTRGGLTLDAPRAALAARYPLAFALGFQSGSAKTADRLPALSHLLASAHADRTGAVVVVFPRKDAIAITTASLIALTRMQHEFPSRLEAYAREGFSIGDRVQVLPSRYVYEYGGLFEGVHGCVRLNIIDGRSDRWYRRHVREPAARSLPATDVFRLIKSSKSKPLGKDNSPLGSWTDTPLDRILEIRTGGNTSLFGTLVYLVTERHTAREFATRTLVADRTGSAALQELGWGRVDEDGVVLPEQSDGGTPIIATSHLLEWVAHSCRETDVGTRHVIIDGIAGALKNLQAFDTAAETQRVLVIAEDEELESVGELAKRGALVWQLEPEDVLLDLGGEGTRVVNPALGTGSVFSAVAAAAVVARSASVEIEEVRDPDLEDIGRALERAEAAFDAAGTPDEQRYVMGGLFSLLMEAAAWYVVPPSSETLAWRTRLEEAAGEVRRERMFLAPEISAALAAAIDGLWRVVAEESRVTARVVALRARIAECRRIGFRTAVATRTPGNAASLRRALAGSYDEVPALPISLVPGDGAFEAVIVASWPRAEALRRLLARHTAPRVHVLATGIECRWMVQLMRSRQALKQRWKASAEVRRRATGGILDTPDEPPPAPVPPSPPPTVSDLICRWDARLRTGPKGRPPDTEVAELDRRQARFVGFVGTGYTYLTLGRRVPVVTDLVRPSGTPMTHVPLRKVDDLSVGDFVLFRSHGDRDIVAQFAELLMGQDPYRALRARAERWRAGLRSIGPTPRVIHDRLAARGLRRDYQTVRSWLVDTDRIAPKTRQDLELIVELSGQTTMRSNLEDIVEAVAEVRSAHIRAGMALSDLLREELPSRLQATSDSEILVDLTFGKAWVLEVDDLGPVEDRNYTEVNRLLGLGDA